MFSLLPKLSKNTPYINRHKPQTNFLRLSLIILLLVKRTYLFSYHNSGLLYTLVLLLHTRYVRVVCKSVGLKRLRYPGEFQLQVIL